MDEEIICPYCNEEQLFYGPDSDIFFSEGNHKFECYLCNEIFRVNTETRYLYEVEELKE